MQVGIAKESFPGERRVALIPAQVTELGRRKLTVVIEAGAGVAAGFSDAAYEEKGARIVATRDELFAQAEILVQVRAYGTNPTAGESDLKRLRRGQVVIGMMDALGSPKLAHKLAQTGVTAFSLELLPRITRAQSMDVLSSMATLAGYKAVLLAATELPKIFPMLMTAAGSLAPAKVFVLGVGVAGLQAIATAKRLGAVVEAYDIRPEVRDQVKSVGGKFVELPLDTSGAGDGGGYAKAQSEDFYRRQQQLLTEHIRSTDVVITTAAVPGRRAPILVTEDMVKAMRPGTVIVDLAAESGGNCALTKAGETIDVGGVRILGPLNVPSSVPNHASQMFSKNVATFLAHLVSKEGILELELDDEITRETLVTKDGAVANERVRQALAT